MNIWLATAAMAMLAPTAAANEQVAKSYDSLQLIHDQYQRCAGHGGILPNSKGVQKHNAILARLQQAAKHNGFAAIIAKADKALPARLVAVDTSCLVGPDVSKASAVSAVVRDLEAAERTFARAIDRLPHPGR